MQIQTLELDTDKLGQEKVQSFFEDKQDVLKVSVGNSINFKIVIDCLERQKVKPNLYALLTKNKDDEGWRLRYIGQRKAIGIKQRLKEHLIKKHPKTGSKLKEIKKELAEGSEIGIKLMAIVPDEMRLYHEAQLLKNLSGLDWNVHR